MKIHPYLNFDGTTEAAFRFYQQALGGSLTEIHRFGSMPAQGFELTEEQKNRVMHVGLALPGGQMIMASDTIPGMGPPHVAGTNYAISVHLASGSSGWSTTRLHRRERSTRNHPPP